MKLNPLRNKLVVCDTRCLLYLDRIGRLELLHALFERVAVPSQVALELDIGKAAVRKMGEDVTVVASSFMVQEAMKAAQVIEGELLSVEVVDLRTVKPLDEDVICESVKKTGRLVVADGGWKTCGLAAEIGSLVAEKAFEFLKAPVRRVTLPDCPAPASGTLESAYYPSSEIICSVLREFSPKNQS